MVCFTIVQLFIFQTVVSHITNLLGTKKTVNEGLVYLAILLPRGSTEIIHENGMTWVVSCIRACENEDASVRNFAYLSLGNKRLSNKYYVLTL